jgi:hypothetical protein
VIPNVSTSFSTRRVETQQMADRHHAGRRPSRAAGDTRRLGDVADCDLLQSLLAEAGIGGLDDQLAGVAGERGRRPGPVNVTDVSEDLAGGQCAEAIHVGQGGGGCAQSGLNIIGGLRDPAVGAPR